ncbi:MAG: YARHG domain-containing protein [Chitinophagales bacterium]|nr:YARHG domain-containing protein [Chitinophagales bacterium]HPR29155.1 YARHG domain-containing protein [Chitinophagales bacterium]HQU77499.1 YARHG domain-containing protein [Chitinophagales bacterium]
MRTCLFLFPAILLASCAGNNERTGSEPDELSASLMLETNYIKPAAPVMVYGIEGYYTGFFEAEEFDANKNYMWSNKITVSIDSLSETTLYGHSVVAGNVRPFSGTYNRADKTWQATVSEPGDDRYDGVFTFSVHSDSLVLRGTWTANDKKLAVTKRKYQLEHRVFSYDPNIDLPEDVTYTELYGSYNEEDESVEAITEDALRFNPSVTLLKKEDIENMYQGDLEVMRNSIYARHGYSFRNRRMRFLFDQLVDWYMPVSVNITGELTDLEKKNIDLLKRYEAHAEKYYDVFGR